MTDIYINVTYALDEFFQMAQPLVVRNGLAVTTYFLIILNFSAGQGCCAVNGSVLLGVISCSFFNIQNYINPGDCSMRLNYMVASFDGQRNDQITVGCPQWSGRDENLISKLKNWKFCSDVPVVVLDVKNGAKSYGQYSQMFNAFPDFDYYIVTEDDFLPVLPNIDSILVKLFEESRQSDPDLGYLCGYERKDKMGNNVACISNGIIAGPVLQKTWDIHNCLPCLGRLRGGSQYIFSRGITTSGHSIRDYKDKYRSLHWRGKNKRDVDVIWQWGSGPDIWVPVEYKKVIVTDGGKIVMASRLPPVPQPRRPQSWEE